MSFEMSFSATYLSTTSRRLLADTSSRDDDDGGNDEGDEEEEAVAVAGGSAADAPEVEVKVALVVLVLVLLVSAGGRGCQGLMMTLPDEVMAAAAPTFGRGAPTRYDRALNWASVDPLALFPTAWNVSAGCTDVDDDSPFVFFFVLKGHLASCPL